MNDDLRFGCKRGAADHPGGRGPRRGKNPVRAPKRAARSETQPSATQPTERGSLHSRRVHQPIPCTRIHVHRITRASQTCCDSSRPTGDSTALGRIVIGQHHPAHARTAAQTSSTKWFIQRCVTVQHPFARCSVHGRQANLRSNTCPGYTKNPSDASVDPNRATTVTPQAPAKCINPESPVTTTRQRDSQPSVCSKPSSANPIAPGIAEATRLTKDDSCGPPKAVRRTSQST